MTQMRQDEVVLLSPTAERRVEESPLAERLPTLVGATIAVVNAFRDQERTNGELFARHVGELLRREGADRILPVRKQDSGNDMTEETLSQITSQCQGAVILEGD